MRTGDPKQMIVWQKSMDMVVLIYEVTRFFPSHEQYGLVNQMRRAAVSVPSNIAEGRRRGTEKDFQHFLRIAFGSASELETQIEIVQRLGYIQDERTTKIKRLLTEVMKMLHVLSNSE